MAEVILKYSASTYQAKINSLESLISRLQGHLDILEGLKNQIPTFWNDPKAVRYSAQISDQIIKVRHAMEETSDLKQLYQENVDQMSRMSQAVDDVIDSVESALSIAESTMSIAKSTMSIAGGGE